jgi:hypothetical protein
LALENPNTNVYSIESDKNWLNYMRTYKIIHDAEQSKRLTFFPIYIGKIKNWGYPINDKYKKNYPNYSSDIFKKIDTNIIDTCLIDGRFRVACAIQVIVNCRNIKYLMIHDYTFRQYYHIIEEFLDIYETCDTLAIFRKKENLNSDKLVGLYDKYKYIKD